MSIQVRPRCIWRYVCKDSRVGLDKFSYSFSHFEGPIKMSNAKVIKPRTVEIKPKIVDSSVKSNTVESLPSRRTKGNVTHKKRASSCSRCNVSFSHQKTESIRPQINTNVFKCEKKAKTCAIPSKPQNAPIVQKDERAATKPEHRVMHGIPRYVCQRKDCYFT